MTYKIRRDMERDYLLRLTDKESADRLAEWEYDTGLLDMKAFRPVLMIGLLKTVTRIEKLLEQVLRDVEVVKRTEKEK